MSLSTTIIVVGVSGVGKSTLIQSVASEIPSCRHVQASHLLKNALKAQAEELRLGAVLDNQKVLIDAFQKVRALAEDVILLDAHCIVDSDHGIEIIPEAVFRSLEPTGFVEVWDEPGAVALRRVLDAKRVRPARDEVTIRNHQTLSSETVEQYAAQIGVPLVRVQSGDAVGFMAAVKAFCSPGIRALGGAPSSC